MPKLEFGKRAFSYQACGINYLPAPMGLYVVNDDVVHVIVCAAQRMGLILLFEVIYFYKYCLFLFVSNKVIFFMFEDS